jgi:iron complex transport system ATP-binding protein
MLAAERLAIGYRHAPVGHDLSLDIAAGEVFCLLGPNGCGKTTLFKTLLGLIPPRGGSVALEGRPFSAFSRAAFARRVGYVPQAGTSYFPFTVLDVVLMGRASRIATFAAPSETDRAAAQSALDTLGIARLAARRFPEISGGERQMVLIARALAQEPGLIVMDEPTASLDFGNQARVIGRIRDLADRGIAVVLSTHDPGHAFACADRVALMRAGRIVATGPPEAVLTPAALRELYGVAVAVAWLEAAGRHVCAPSLDQTRRKP